MLRVQRSAVERVGARPAIFGRSRAYIIYYIVYSFNCYVVTYIETATVTYRSIVELLIITLISCPW
jgi:hypothetical protein